MFPRFLINLIAIKSKFCLVISVLNLKAASKVSITLLLEDIFRPISEYSRKRCFRIIKNFFFSGLDLKKR